MTYEESRNTFSNLKFKKKNVYKFLIQNNLQIFTISSYFVEIKNSDTHKNV